MIALMADKMFNELMNITYVSEEKGHIEVIASDKCGADFFTFLRRKKVEEFDLIEFKIECMLVYLTQCKEQIASIKYHRDEAFEAIRKIKKMDIE